MTRCCASGSTRRSSAFRAHIAAERLARSSSSTGRSSTPPHDLVCAYKPQFAHYAAYEAEDQLERTIEYIHRTYPAMPVILDAKRGDVGNTAERYAIEAFERYAADAVTVNPYLGSDALEPFLRHADKGVIILCRTSNPGAPRPAGPRGRRAASSTRWWRELAAARWNGRGNCAAGGRRHLPARARRGARAWSATCRCWCPGSAPRAAMSRRRCSTGRAPHGTGLIVSSSRSHPLRRLGGADFAAGGRTAALRAARADQRRRTGAHA